jgi:hypothetical protein
MLLTMGDRFAVSCSMVISDSEWDSPRVAERVCYGIRVAFRESDPGAFVCTLDGCPVFSCFLLERLLAHASDSESRGLISEVLQLCCGILEERDVDRR